MMNTAGFVIDYDELGTIQEESLEQTDKRGFKTWGDSFRAALSRGEDYGRAAFIADEWEKRQIDEWWKCDCGQRVNTRPSTGKLVCNSCGQQMTQQEKR
jgi:hypothetical protein